MTTAVNPLVSAVNTPKVDALALGAKKHVGTADEAEAKKLKDATRQFEAVLLRQMLSCLEKTTSMQGGKEAGSSIYGSMLVDAVSDAIARAGGLGLATMLERSLEPQLARQGANPEPLSGNNHRLESMSRRGASAVTGTGREGQP